MKNETRIGSYFYPNEPSCPVRTERAGGKRVESEPVLSRQTRSLFSGHDQPRSYCLGDARWNDWDDSDLNVAERHIDLANDAALDFFIVDSYLGIRNGMKIQESGGFLSRISNLPSSRLGNIHFGMMCCFRAPRTIMAIRPGDLEKNRGFDASLDTARFIVDHSAIEYWNHPNYLRIWDRPYISFFLPGTGATGENANEFRSFFNELRQHSLYAFGIEPYIVGVVSHKTPVADAPALQSIGVDAVTGYSNILNFPQVEPAVDHAPLIDARVSEWREMGNLLHIPVQPTAQIGLDTSPRCEYTDEDGNPFQPTSVDQLRPFIGKYPHSSIVLNSTPETFAVMLKKLTDIVGDSVVSSEEKIITINAWNEMTEGSCMLPRIRDNEIDTSYIDTCREIIRTLAQSE